MSFDEIQISSYYFPLFKVLLDMKHCYKNQLLLLSVVTFFFKGSRCETYLSDTDPAKK